MKCIGRLFIVIFIVGIACLGIQAEAGAGDSSGELSKTEASVGSGDGKDPNPEAKKIIEQVEQALQAAKDESGQNISPFIAPQGVSMVPGASDEEEQAPHVGTGPLQASLTSMPTQQSISQPPMIPQTVESESAGEEASAASDDESASVLLEAFVDKSTVTIGEQIKYSIVVDFEKGIKVEFPQFGENLGGFGVKDFNISKPKKSGWNRIKQEQWYLLDSYTVGSYVIPPQSVRVTLQDGKTKTLTSPEIFVEVRSVLSEGEADAGLRDIKAPLEIPMNTRLILMIVFTVAAVALLLGALGWAIYIKRSKQKAVVPPLPAHEVAYRELKRIEGLDLIQKAQVKEYYYLVSNCLRTYLEDRFSLKAPEQTTEEFLESVSQGDALEGKHINLFKDYLRHCDLVKYAKLEPDQGQAEELIIKTRKFIDETKVVQEESDELEEVEA